MSLPCAEDVNYWKTGRSSPDTKLDAAAAMIADVGGEVVGQAIGRMNGESAVMLAFTLSGEPHQILWPVLVTKDGSADTPAARIQAATFVYHDVKAKCMVAKVLGAKAAFVGNRLLEGKSVMQLAEVGLLENAPRLLTGPPN